MNSTKTNQVFNTIAAQKFFFWGKFGVGINANLCDEVLEPILNGLKILVSRVQVSFLALCGYVSLTEIQS
jgi:hypothetical protein